MCAIMEKEEGEKGLKDKVILELTAAKKHLLRAAELMPSSGRIGDWSKREILAHVAGWSAAAIPDTRAILEGKEPSSFGLSPDEFNAHSVESRRNQSAETTVREINRLHRRWIKVISSLSESQITGYFGTKFDQEPLNVLWLIEQSIAHDQAHAEEIESNFPQRVVR